MSQALSGIRVLDFTRMLAGPFCTVILQELGAEVIKLEFRESGDAVRTIPPITEGGEGYTFMVVNRGKKSITLDPRSSEGHKIALDLAAKCDILVENFAPGVMKKLGLNYDEVLKVNPKIIYCSMSGYGQDGPSANKPAFDMIAQAMGGMMSLTGFPDSPPTKCGPSVADMGGGLYADVAILAALHYREKTGEGQFLDISMQDCIWAMTTPEAAGAYFIEGRKPNRIGNEYQNIVPWNAYPASDGFVIICIVTVGHFQKFAELMGRPDLISDPESLPLVSRVQHRAKHNAAVVEWVKDKTVAEVLKLMCAAGLPAAPVLDLVQVANDPQIAHREMVVEVNQLLSGPVKMPGSVFKMSKTPGNPRNPSPFLGEHNNEVYSELLGYSEEKVAELMEKEVI
jgi:crotonobetainyl-CoA:carnitine CoA-transferase CaiB-like acyl-CoA transferase